MVARCIVPVPEMYPGLIRHMRTALSGGTDEKTSDFFSNFGGPIYPPGETTLYRALVMTGPGRMITIMTTKNSGKGPVTRKGTIFPILGAALLVTCLLAGFAQAADSENALNENAIMALTPLFTDTVANGQADSGSEPAGYCGTTKLKCWAEVKINGNWTTVMIGYASHPCDSQVGIDCYPSRESTEKSCARIYRGVDIVEGELVDGKCD